MLHVKRGMYGKLCMREGSFWCAWRTSVHTGARIFQLTRARMHRTIVLLKVVGSGTGSGSRGARSRRMMRREEPGGGAGNGPQCSVKCVRDTAEHGGRQAPDTPSRLEEYAHRIPLTSPKTEWTVTLRLAVGAQQRRAGRATEETRRDEARDAKAAEAEERAARTGAMFIVWKL